MAMTAGAWLSAQRCIHFGMSLCRSRKTTSASGQAARTSAAYSLVTFFGVLTSTGKARGPASSGGAWVLEPGAAQPAHPVRLRSPVAEECRVAVSPLVGLPRGGGNGQPCFSGAGLAIDGAAPTGIESAAHSVDAVLLRQR